MERSREKFGPDTTAAGQQSTAAATGDVAAGLDGSRFGAPATAAGRQDTAAGRPDTAAGRPDTAAAVGLPGPRMSHRGSGRELFSIMMVNLSLKIVTVGIYHFWAKTRVRRYIWSRTFLAGEPLEYTGKGRELFLGYLVALAILLSAIGGTVLVLFLTESIVLMVLAAVLAYPLFLFLSGFALFSSRRYLLSRTRWRSIRFGMTGSRARHGLLLLGLTLLVGLSLGLAVPMMRNRLANHLIENTWLGDKKFGYEGQNLDIYKKIFLPLLAGFGMLIGFMVLFGVASEIFSEAVAGDWDPNFRESIAKIEGVVFLVFLVLWWIAMGLIYMAVEYRFIAENTVLGGLRFKLGYTIWGFLRFNFTNLLLMTLTFSLAFPWVVGRIVRFTARHLSLEGDLDLESIGQHPHGVPGTGEGLAEAFDLGSI